MSPHRTDRGYAQRLAELRQHLLQMAHVVEAMIADSVRAFMQGDAALARETMRVDLQVDQHELEIDELCRTILARFQPLASDLRFVTTTMKMVTDLERIGDLASNVCERVVEYGRPEMDQPLREVSAMAEVVRKLLARSVHAYLDGNVAEARSVLADDDLVDQLYTTTFRQVVALMRADSARVPEGMSVLSVIKWLERMGDHATNLAEQAVFLVDGKDIRHEGKRLSSVPAAPKRRS